MQRTAVEHLSGSAAAEIERGDRITVHVERGCPIADRYGEDPVLTGAVTGRRLPAGERRPLINE